MTIRTFGCQMRRVFKLRLGHPGMCTNNRRDRPLRQIGAGCAGFAGDSHAAHFMAHHAGSSLKQVGRRCGGSGSGIARAIDETRQPIVFARQCHKTLSCREFAAIKLHTVQADIGVKLPQRRENLVDRSVGDFAIGQRGLKLQCVAGLAVLFHRDGRKARTVSIRFVTTIATHLDQPFRTANASARQVDIMRKFQRCRLADHHTARLTNAA